MPYDQRLFFCVALFLNRQEISISTAFTQNIPWMYASLYHKEKSNKFETKSQFDVSTTLFTIVFQLTQHCWVGFMFQMNEKKCHSSFVLQIMYFNLYSKLNLCKACFFQLDLIYLGRFHYFFN